MNTQHEEALKSSFNKFLNRILTTGDKDCYANLSLSDFIEPRKAVSTASLRRKFMSPNISLQLKG